MIEDPTKQPEKPKLTTEQAADRLLVLLCSLTGGDTRKTVSREELLAEVKRIGLFKMSESEFDNYLNNVSQAINAPKN